MIQLSVCVCLCVYNCTSPFFITSLLTNIRSWKVYSRMSHNLGCRTQFNWHFCIVNNCIHHIAFIQTISIVVSHSNFVSFQEHYNSLVSVSTPVTSKLHISNNSAEQLNAEVQLCTIVNNAESLIEWIRCSYFYICIQPGSKQREIYIREYAERFSRFYLVSILNL